MSWGVVVWCAQDSANAWVEEGSAEMERRRGSLQHRAESSNGGVRVWRGMAGGEEARPAATSWRFALGCKCEVSGVRHGSS